MDKVKRKDFFKKSTDTSVNQNNEDKKVTDANNKVTETSSKHIHVVPVSKDLIDKVIRTISALREIKLNALANEAEYVLRKVQCNKFRVAIVGEFSKGKSTFLNRLLKKDILPTGTLPTTALLTHIKYGSKDRMIVVGKNRKEQEVPLVSKSWQSLVAANFGAKEPEGYVIVETPNPIMNRYGVEFIDTPGAGDLEEKRAQVIERCLLATDAAIITISADQILSLTEQQFIRRKIISKSTPFMAIALTKLDRINKEDRDGVIDYLHKKLKNIKLSIPVFIADDKVELPSEKYEEIKGTKFFMKLLGAWLSHKKRHELTENWVVKNVSTILEMASVSLQEQKMICDAKDDEKEKLIAERNVALSKLSEKWDILRREMENRCKSCIDLLNNKISEATETITEGLKFEIRHQNNLKEWVENDYAYRVKRELTALSLSVDQMVKNQISADLYWLNDQLSKQFKETVHVELTKVDSKDDFRDVYGPSRPLEDIKDKTVQTTLVSSGVTIAAAMLLLAGGVGTVLVATMGVGTGANIISKKILEKKIDAQRAEVQSLVAKEVPQIIKDASADTEVKVKILYNSIISEAFATETRWMQTQRTLIRQSIKAKDEDTIKALETKIQIVNDLKKEFIK